MVNQLSRSWPAWEFSVQAVCGGAHCAKPKRSQRRKTWTSARSAKLNGPCPSSGTSTLSIRIIHLKCNFQLVMTVSKRVPTRSKHHKPMVAASNTRRNGLTLEWFELMLKMQEQLGSSRLAVVGGVVETTISLVSNSILAMGKPQEKWAWPICIHMRSSNCMMRPLKRLRS